MSESLYPFADGDRLEDRNTYFYTPYGGIAFLDAWRRRRKEALAGLPAATPPPIGRGERLPEPGPVETAALLDGLFAALESKGAETPAVRHWLDELVKKFEVTKRMHVAYDARFQAVDRGRYRDFGLYVRLAEVLEAAYAGTGDLVFLNAMLKCIDTLSSACGRLATDDGARLAWLIERERLHVDALEGAIRSR